MLNFKRRRRFPLWLAVAASLAVAFAWGVATFLILFTAWFFWPDEYSFKPGTTPIAVAFIIAVVGGAIASGFLFLRRVGRHRIKVDERYCPKCDYNLTGNVSGICPKCGEPIGNGAQGTRL